MDAAPHDFGLLSECRQLPGIALIGIALIGPLLRFWVSSIA